MVINPIFAFLFSVLLWYMSENATVFQGAVVFLLAWIAFSADDIRAKL